MKKLLTFITLVFCSGICFSQSLSKKDMRFLYQAIEIFIGDRELHTEKRVDRNSEFFFCFLEIDSAGKVKDIRLFSNDKNHDSTFIILSRIEAGIFDKWKSDEKCRNKIIMIPIYSYVSDGKTSSDVKALREFYSRTPTVVIEEKKNIIIGSLLTYNTPHTVK